MDHVGNIALKGGGQLRTLRVDNLVADPVTPFVGQMWTNTVENSFKGYNGVEVITFASGGNTALLQTEIDTLETAVGVAADGTFVLPALTNYLGSATDVVGLSVLLDVQLKAANDAVAQEASNRAAADTSIRTDFAAADTTLQGAINLATAARITADNSIRADFAAADAALQDAIVAEEVARAAEDVSIRADFAAADTALGASVTQEVTDRTAADTAIRAEFAAADVIINTALGNEVTARTNADISIRNDFAAADSSLTNAIIQETGARETADTAIRTDFAAADATLATAITAEETARIAADALKVSKAGDSMSGNLAFGAAGTVTGITEPVNSSDAATKNYVDNSIVGLSWKDAVDVMSADHGAIATGALAVGYRVIDTTDDNIYTWSGSAWTSYTPADGDAAFDKTDETGYVFDGTNWTQFTGGGQIAAGVGLAKTGNRLDINMGAGITQLPTDEVGIDLYTTGGLMLTVDGTTPSTDTSAQIGILLDGDSLALTADGLALSATTLAAISASTTGLAQETIERIAGDAALTTALAQEVTDRTAADTAIRTDFAAADTTISTALALETSDRISDIVDVRAEQVAADAAISATLTQEIADRAAADTAIRSDFAAADAALQTAIDASDAAISTINTQITALQSADTAEALARTTEDAAIRTDFAAADTAIQGEVDAIETAVGLDSSGNLSAFTLTNYLDAATTVRAALIALDTATKAVSTALEGSSYLYTGAVAQTDHVVPHVLGKQFVQVMVVDSANKKIQPDAITFDSANQLTVSFISAITCKVYVTR